MDDLRDAYKATILRILGKFQLLEFALKVYISIAYSAISTRVSDVLHFDYSEKDVESFPLERLTNIFSKLNSNKGLILRINKLREERNHIAHRSLIVTMGSMYDRGAVEDKYHGYFWLEDELDECLKKVIEETHTLTKRMASQPDN
ncbi:hypothetical protein [Pseudomonas brassicacearum]|uniref:hypothetical protein n=1 Tax=Pseudomonas brassicacearum TaxID=930166 RepID=UPI001BDE6AFC|nr:hypothetical protein [Pseudomonas brassicacearum]